MHELDNAYLTLCWSDACDSVKKKGACLCIAALAKGEDELLHVGVGLRCRTIMLCIKITTTQRFLVYAESRERVVMFTE